MGFNPRQRPDQQPKIEVEVDASVSRRRRTVFIPDEIDWVAAGAVAPVQNQVSKSSFLVHTSQQTFSGAAKRVTSAFRRRLPLYMPFTFGRLQANICQYFRFCFCRCGWPSGGAFGLTRNEILDTKYFCPPSPSRCWALMSDVFPGICTIIFGDLGQGR